MLRISLAVQPLVLVLTRFLQRPVQRRRRQPAPLPVSVLRMRDQRLLGDLAGHEQLLHLFRGEWVPYGSVSNALPRHDSDPHTRVDVKAIHCTNRVSALHRTLEPRTSFSI